MRATLRFENVGLRFAAGPELLADLDLTLEPGEVVLLTGSRGAGKTLIAELATLARRPDRGRVCLLGRATDLLARDDAASLRRCIGYGAERPLVVPDLSAAENVALPLLVAGVSREQARADAGELIRWLGDPGLAGRLARTLAPADLRRVALARALVSRPALVVLDEPVRVGDDLLVDRLATLVGQMSQQGTSFLVTALDERLAERLDAPTLYRLSGGRLESVDRPTHPPLG